MNKLNSFAILGILFLSSGLLGIELHTSLQIFAQENEAEVKADIEQENKCLKDSECENENKIDNKLSITNNGTQSQQQPTSPTCETCFTDNLTPDEITTLGNAWASGTGGDINSVEEFCSFAEQNVANPDVIAGLLAKGGFIAQINEETINTIADCLEDVYGIVIPPIN